MRRFNNPPVADDQDVETGQDTGVDITLTGSDPNNDLRSFIITSLAGSGDLSESGTVIDTVPHALAGDMVEYTPHAGESGTDSVGFKVNDGAVDRNNVLVAVHINIPPILVRCNRQDATIVGTVGADILVGTPGKDVIVGLAGDDVILGMGGNDVICAGKRDDLVRGGGGADWISGDAGHDVLLGGMGVDKLLGKGGDDYLRGGDQNDKLFGHGGNDILAGGNGNDLLSGGGNSDLHAGGSGDDTIKCGAGKDIADGGAGLDTGAGCETKINIP